MFQQKIQMFFFRIASLIISTKGNHAHLPPMVNIVDPCLSSVGVPDTLPEASVTTLPLGSGRTTLDGRWRRGFFCGASDWLPSDSCDWDMEGGRREALEFPTLAQRGKFLLSSSKSLLWPSK